MYGTYSSFIEFQPILVIICQFRRYYYIKKKKIATPQPNKSKILLLLLSVHLQQAEVYVIGTALMNYQIDLSNMFTILTFFEKYFI